MMSRRQRRIRMRNALTPRCVAAIVTLLTIVAFFAKAAMKGRGL